ncbi:MAG: hypothetical protein ABH882_04310 [Candidatus Omnitrophota bacterium]|nr:hypothetical protein [Candidatus Omnitrophota bacterium]MBU1928327.1 hypothetical protein [Candidatus Omnitrophota bacterium]MBU2034357.1 hypothetical protein [Candidatus Omnitrophota bacterium]MBU2221434.1 hypothetical protein [Candidatus Omnitrophota bacterium]
MENKNTCFIKSILWVAAILMLLAAAFDILPVSDNKVIFLALSCFIVAGVIKMVEKGGGCCK